MLLLSRLDAHALLHAGAVPVSAGRFPYEALVEENRRRSRRGAGVSSWLDTGIFDENRYFDVLVEYAKAAPTTS